MIGLRTGSNLSPEVARFVAADDAMSMDEILTPHAETAGMGDGYGNLYDHVTVDAIPNQEGSAGLVLPVEGEGVSIDTSTQPPTLVFSNASVRVVYLLARSTQGTGHTVVSPYNTSSASSQHQVSGRYSGPGSELEVS